MSSHQDLSCKYLQPLSGSDQEGSSVACLSPYGEVNFRDRLIAQYRDSSEVSDFIGIYEQQAKGEDSVLTCFKDLSMFFCIDNAVGEWLDIIGIIVGVSRFVKGGIIIPFFGFATHVSAQSYGTLTDGKIGGYWRHRNQPLTGSSELDDVSYRLVIKGQIAKNNYKGDLNNTIEVFTALFGVRCNVFDLTGDYTVLINKELDPIERALVLDNNVVPKVLGFNMKVLSGPAPYFGFQGFPCIQGFDTGTLIGELA